MPYFNFPDFSFFKNRRVLILTHKGADVDAIASAGALLIALRPYAKTVEIAVPEHINLEAKTLAKNLNIPYSFNADFSSADCLIIVELNSFAQLSNFSEKVKSFKGEKFLIDHHEKTFDEIVPSKNATIIPEAFSNSELILKLLKQNKAEITAQTVELLCAGIISDSAQFINADKETFSLMSELLLKTKKPYKEILLSFHAEQDSSMKIAQLKAAKRCRIFKAGELIIASTEVGAFEADAAMALLSLGADIAFAGDSNEKTKQIVISSRASNNALKSSGIDLAHDVMLNLGKFFEGTGGGHSGAAAFNGTGTTVTPLLEKCVSLCLDKLREKDPSLSLKEFK